MKLKFMKNIRIINDLLCYCHNIGATDYDIHFSPTHDTASFIIRAKIPDIPPNALEKLNATLKLPRVHEVEQNYWELGGIGNPDDSAELTLISMMLDESYAVYEDGVLIISANRRE